MEEIGLTSETLGKIPEFIIRYANLQIEKKKIDSDIKELKKEFEEQGLPTGQIIKAFNEMKKEVKNGASLVEELETIKDILYKSSEIHDKITQLLAKI
jgi:uncharacterized protein (UPF0335 family)